MSINPITKSVDLGNGKPISIETGKLAKQADGSVVVRQGNTMLLATVVSAKEAREGMNFLPLTVEYLEKYASAGKFPGGFFKREARPSEHEILIARLVDRALRPLFPDDYRSETQVIISLISAEKNTPPDALACLAASAAIAVSDIPFNGPVAEARVVRINGEFQINPSLDLLESADLDLLVAANKDNVIMVEGEMNEVSEKEMVEAIAFAHEAIKKACEVQLELAEAKGTKDVYREYSQEEKDEAFEKRVWDATFEKCKEIALQGLADKHKRSELLKAVKEEFKESLSEEELEEKGDLIGGYFHNAEKEAIRSVVLDKRVRLDGRKLDEVRPIWSEVNYLPSAHGSAIFTRGETQSLTTVTLGTKLDAQTIDGALIEGSHEFMLHYNFPPFCTGEAKFLRSTSRREIGHGNLALRALKRVIPSDNPYTIRVVSDVLESNGSSSMATVCAGTLALMDAGVKIKKPVSGIAMGLITDKSGKFAVLSDILGDEDHLGDMDFKITGTKDGITACQMDIKVDGLPYEVLTQALEQAKAGRAHIMNEMLKTIDAPREDFKPHAPRIVTLTVEKDLIGAIIGPGGKIIQEIQNSSGAKVSIEEVDGKGYVEIFSENKESIDQALAKIKGIISVPEPGEVYEGVVKSIMPYGAFVEFLPGKQGLLHISEISWTRIENLDGVFSEGDTVKVKLLEVDKKTGKYRLSRKVLLPKEAEEA
ncbi:MAG: polyribonucleotide nucleotidyltransferase [Chitinophagales bacterium]